MSTTSPAKQSPQVSQTSTAQPATERNRSTSGGENRGLTIFFIGAAVVALMLVVFFNVQGPEGAARSGVGDGPARSPAGETTGGPSPVERGTAERSPAPVGQNSTTASGSNGGANPASTVPQAPDSQTPVGREGVGAPRGAMPQQGTTQVPASPGTGSPNEPSTSR